MAEPWNTRSKQYDIHNNSLLIKLTTGNNAALRYVTSLKYVKRYEIEPTDNLVKKPEFETR